MIAQVSISVVQQLTQSTKICNSYNCGTQEKNWYVKKIISMAWQAISLQDC